MKRTIVNNNTTSSLQNGFERKHSLTHSQTVTPFDGSGRKTLWGKEILFVQAISPFSKMFSSRSKTKIIIFVTFKFSSPNALNSVWFKVWSCGNGLKCYSPN